MVSFAGRPAGALPSSITVLCLAVQSCSAAMASWWTDLGAQVIRQNETTGAIMYSFCNSSGTPIFPVDPPNILSLGFEPRNGTALTGKGWWDNSKTVASIFYQNKDGDIVNSFHECNHKTGKFNKLNDRIISDDKPPVHSTTGLASVLLSETDGYRVYYHDTNKTIQSIGYDPTANTFYHAGVVSRDTTSGFAIGAQFQEKTRNITLAYPRDSDNIGVARANSDGRYWLATTPRPLFLGTNVTANTNLTNATDIRVDAQSATNFSLAAWTGNPKSIEVAIDKAVTRSIFYIGSDRALHHVGNINWVWKLMNTNLSTSVWPLADEPNAELALASHQPSSIIRIYYMVNKTLTEIKFDKDGLWKPAMPLPVVSANASPPPADPSGNPADPAQSGVPDQHDSSPGQLSLGAKAGIGVGVAVGVLAIMGLVLVICIMKRKKKAQVEAEAEVKAQAEEEERQKTALAAQHQQQQQQYYYGHGGSPPQQQPATPFSDGTGSMWGGYDKKSMGGGAGSPPPPMPPQELHSVASAHELADPRYTPHELPDQRPTLEMDGHGSAGPESQALMHHGQPNYHKP